MIREAISTLEECLTLQLSFLPKLHVDVSKSKYTKTICKLVPVANFCLFSSALFSLGSVYKMADMNKALDYMKESFYILEAIQPVHSDTVTGIYTQRF